MEKHPPKEKQINLTTESCSLSLKPHKTNLQNFEQEEGRRKTKKEPTDSGTPLVHLIPNEGREINY